MLLLDSSVGGLIELLRPCDCFSANYFGCDWLSSYLVKFVVTITSGNYMFRNVTVMNDVVVAIRNVCAPSA